METTNDASKTEDEQGKFILKLFPKFLHVLNLLYCFSFQPQSFCVLVLCCWPSMPS